jgi:tetratricopeptide (TPR) repeat protein
MKIVFYAWLVVICLFLPGPEVHPQRIPETMLHNSLNRGIDLILKQEYSRADSVFGEAVHKFPDHPAGYLYRAAVMQAYSIDFDVNVEEARFDSLLDIGKSRAENLDSPWREYYLGMADGSDAYARIESGDWLGGVRKGISSASEFETVVETDSDFYDAYVGLGTYYYWSSRKTAFIRWLPFVRDNREEGIRLLLLGARNSVYSRFAAVSALVSIYLDSEEFADAEKWSRYGLDSYPGNRIFLWGYATSLDRQKKYREAVVAYERLLENLVHAGAPHPYGEIVCRLNLVKSELALKDTVGSAEHLRIILSYGNFIFPENIRSRAEAKLKEAAELAGEMESRKNGSK